MKEIIYIKEWLENNLSSKRFHHSLGCAETAQKLAKLFNLDENKAYLAGLIHDCAKNFDDEKSLAHFIPTKSFTCGVGYAACALASSLSAKAILVTTTTGDSAANICRFRPTCDVIALTPNLKTYYKMAMFWGVTPLLDQKYYNTDELLESARVQAKKFKCVKKGDVVIQTAGIKLGETGSNMLVVSEIN